MEEVYSAEDIKERLIIAGIRELETHGLNDFSLRRVAMVCEVSCAAPYRHFRSKDELILEIIRYINRQWFLLQEQIKNAFPDDQRRQLVEIGIAHIRFWIANPNFRSILLLDDPDTSSPRHTERKQIHLEIDRLVRDYCRMQGASEERSQALSYAYQALIYGTVLMLGNQELDNDAETIRMIRTRVESLLNEAPR